MGTLLTATRRVVNSLQAGVLSDPSLLVDLEATIKPLLPPPPLTYVSEQVIDESESTEGKTYILKLECETQEMYTSNSLKFINGAGDILFQLYSTGGNNSGGYGEIRIGSEVSGQKEEIVLGWEFARLSSPTLRTIDVTEEGFEYTMPSTSGTCFCLLDILSFCLIPDQECFILISYVYCIFIYIYTM